MATEPEKVGPRPNPYRDPGPFGHIEIGGVEVPGILQSIGGVTAKQDWSFQKASGGAGEAANSATPDAQPGATTPAGGGTSTVKNVEPTRGTGANFKDSASATSAKAAGGGVSTAGSFGVSVWRGALLCEEIEIETAILNEQDYDAALDFMAVMMPKRGKKPPSLTLLSADANAIGVTRCAIRELTPPMEDKPGSGKRSFKFKLCEYNPKQTAPAGKADPAKPAAEPTPKDAQEKELQELLDKARQ